MEGEVKAVNAVEFGADMKGSEIRRSCGDTVAMLVVELDALLFRSKTVGRAGDENAVVEAPPSKDVKSSKSRSCVGSKPRVLRSRGRICSLP